MVGPPPFYSGGRYTLSSNGEGSVGPGPSYYAQSGAQHYANAASPAAGSSASGSSSGGSGEEGHRRYRTDHDAVSQERQSIHKRSAGDAHHHHRDEERRGATATDTATTTPADRKVSCLECRQSKVKCSGQPPDGADGGGACDRCMRMRRACVFAQHRRGRRPAKVKMHKLEQSVDTIMNALSVLQEFKQSKEEGGSLVRPDDDGDARIRPSRKRAALNATVEGESDTRRRVNDVLPLLPKSTLATGRVDMLTAELGQPPLSNPLKLLAQASDSRLQPARVDGEDAAVAASLANEELGDEDDAATVPDENGAGTAQQRPSAHTQAGRAGAARRGYWRIDMYSSRLDVGPLFDPITLGIVTLSDAEELYDLYMRHLNETITLLDPILHTFDYARAHSALLLSASCALAARFAARMPNAESIADKLDKHIQDTLLPTILLKGYRSAEIAEALIILAAYHCNTPAIDGDRSWSLVGFAIRIAAELDMNARLHSDAKLWRHSSNASVASLAATPMSKEERTERILRNRERTWCNLWLYEHSLSTHMGRRSTLSVDPVIIGVGAGPGWHTSPYALPGDEAIVALIGLRRLQMKNTDFFEHSVSSVGGDLTTLQFQLDFYRNTCRADINDWLATHVERRGGAAVAGDQSFRMKNARLYASYACLILNSFALKCTSEHRLLRPFYEDSYGAAMTYLSLYAERIRAAPAGLTYVHNSSVVTAAYVAVFALKLCALADGDEGDAGGTHAYIDSAAVNAHVRALADEMARAGGVTAWRNGAASSYAPYLTAVLERVTQRHEKHGSNGGADVGQTAAPSLQDAIKNCLQEHADLQSAAESATEASAAASSEALHYIAGPSGVQAATVLDAYSLNDDALFLGGDVNGEAATAFFPFDYQFLEGSSLFRDMSMLFGSPAASAPTPHVGTSAP